MGWKEDFDDENNTISQMDEFEKAWKLKRLIAFDNMKADFIKYFSEEGAVTDHDIKSDAYGLSIRAIYNSSQKIELQLDGGLAKVNSDSISDRKHYCELVMNSSNSDNRVFYGILIGLSKKIESNLNIDEKIKKLNELDFTYSVFEKNSYFNHGFGIPNPTKYSSFYDALKSELK